MRQEELSSAEVLAGYDAVSRLYPHIPLLTTWRAWEWAAHRRFGPPEPVLDAGCGDGAFFRLVWPGVRDVTGVEIDPGVVEVAMRSGIYREIHSAPTHRAPLPQLAAAIGEPARARMLEEEYERYHHHANPCHPRSGPSIRWTRALVSTCTSRSCPR